jgi:hypothetical protein
VSYFIYRYAEVNYTYCLYAEYRILFFVMLNVFMLKNTYTECCGALYQSKLSSLKTSTYKERLDII